ncbi:MAG: hypothetical protein MJH11_11750 [Lentisphaeria bacterium]|nr:hypothetical protein [Lentisphaeria bacterium]
MSFNNRVNVLMVRMPEGPQTKESTAAYLNRPADYKYANFQAYYEQLSNERIDESLWHYYGKCNQREFLIKRLSSTFKQSEAEVKTAIKSGDLFVNECWIYHASVLGRKTAFYLFFNKEGVYKGHFYLWPYISSISSRSR